MERSTVFALLVVVGLGALAWWYYSQPTGAPAGTPVQPNACGSQGSGGMTKVYGVTVCTNPSLYYNAGKTAIKGAVTTPLKVLGGLVNGNLSVGNWRDGPVPVPKQPLTDTQKTAINGSWIAQNTGLHL